MKPEKRVPSIARRIARGFTGRLILILLLVDLAVAGLCAAGFCVAAERAALGGAWDYRATSERRFKTDDTQPFLLRMDSATYIFVSGGKEYSVYAGEYFKFARGLLTVLLIGEGVLILFEYASGKRRARSLLRPLDRMAEKALSLSEKPREIEGAVSKRLETMQHNLETAILQVPEGGALHTGDKELQGLEEAVNSLLKRREDAVSEQTRFVSDASHELRTPIAVIRGYADMLARWGKKDEKVLDESIFAIRQEAERMQTLVEQLLFLARGDDGRVAYTPQTVLLSALAKEVCDESRMIDPDHDYRLLLPDENEPPAFGDPALLKQAFRILADNARKYSAQGERITLRVFAQDGAPRFSVQDNGIGIAKADIPHIFERFYRSDPARARKTGGAGLGLAIAKWIVDRHGGYFDILSREGAGTRMTVCLPKAEG